MSKYKVLTDGNGSKLIQVVGMGLYMPLDDHQAMVKECEYSSKLLAEAMTERDNALAQNAEQLAVIEYAYNKLYILSHNRKDVSARLLGDADKGFEAVRAYLSLNKTPSQHLRDRDAEAGRAGFVACLNLASSAGLEWVTYHDADRYAEKVRRGEV